MNLAFDRFRLHAYVDGELTPDEVADFERLLATDPQAMAEVAALRAQGDAMHARYDALLTAAPEPVVRRLQRADRTASFGTAGHALARTATRFAVAASLVIAAAIGLGAGWIARGQADRGESGSIALRSNPTSTPAGREVEGRLQAFVQVASVSHAVFVPEVRHPVEVTASDEGHLVAWLSKRLDAPLVVPHLADAGWDLLGGRLLPAASGPVAQFMYQDHAGRRMTLAVSKSVAGQGDVVRSGAPGVGEAASPAAFRIAEENGNTVFYWIDTGYAYALTGKLSRGEMTALAGRVYRQLDR